MRIDESPPAIATCSLSDEKSTANTPRDRPVTVPVKGVCVSKCASVWMMCVLVSV